MLKQNCEFAGGDSRWRCENNPGLEPALNSQTVSQCCISRLIFVAHRTGKFPSIKETRDARQYLWRSRHPGWWRPALPSAPHRARLSGCPVELAT